jgi:spore germination protein YaaH
MHDHRGVWTGLGGALAVLFAMAIPVTGRAAQPKMIGFYAPWDGASLASLQQHGRDLQAVVPTWISVTGPEHKVTVVPDAAGHAALASLKGRTPLWLMVQNALMGAWDGPGAAALLHDKVATAALLDQLETVSVREKAGGFVVDFEDLPAAAQPDLAAFLAAARQRCRRHGWILVVTAPAANPDWNLAAIGRTADRVILMAYDEHWQTGAPGPIASDPWFASVVKPAIQQIPPGATIVAVASYAYDWPAKGPATVLSIAQAEALAMQNGVRPERDPASGSEHFAYTAGGVAHVVWMSDAASVRGQIAVARAIGARGVALWRLGTEDPAVWGPVKAAK